MKKFLASLLTLVMLLAVGVSASAVTDPNTLIVGTPAMNGDFIEGFGNSSYDASIKRILGAQSGVIALTSADELVLNETVVENMTTELDDAGNKTYTYKLHEDLLWSDGEPITAKDFVFNVLFSASPTWVEAGASSNIGYGLLGYDAYNKGETDVFAGVKLIDDYTFALVIDNEFLPYFHELSYASADPSPLHVYAPECTIASDDAGAKIEGDLLAALQNVAATERFAPSISSGPYKFVSFENQTVTLELNENFKGTFEGKKPQIQYVVQKFIPQDTDVDQVIAREVDIVAGVIEGAKIEAAKASETTNTHSYFRNGYGHLSMHCDWGVTADANVRWALGYLLDRNEVVDYVLGGYGGIVHSQYGYAQWMYEEMAAELEDALVPFNLNLDKANEYLDQTEWVFEADGKTPFDASKADAEGTYMRHNADGEMLVVRHLGTEDNTVTDIIEIQYTANAPLAGMKFEVTKSDFQALLDNYYYGFEKGDDRLYNTFNLAVSFGSPFDPYTNWHSDFFGKWQNSSQVNDPELDAAIEDMRNLEATQIDEYLDAWLRFVVRFQEILPQIPLYSNEYFDISDISVQGLNTTPFWTWDYLVCEITKTAE